MDPGATLEHGNAIVATILLPAGFALEPTTTGESSGGAFARSRWSKESQAIELHVRSGLGIVRYCWGAEMFDHGHLVTALGLSASYPGYSDDPLDGFRHLAEDLQKPPLARVLGPDHIEVLSAARQLRPPGRVLP